MKSRSFSLVGLAALFAVVCISASAQKMKPEEILAKHLDSIATAEKRAALKTIIAVGDARVTNVTRKLPPTVGRAVFASAGNKSFLGLNLNSNDYAGERIVFDGSRTSIDFSAPGVRSVLGTTLQSSNVLVEDGIFGGALSTNWSMMHSEARRAKMSAGTKKIDGKQMHVIEYAPRKGSDWDITYFFDAETFRHVRTEYRRTASASIGRTIDESARQSETRLRMVEDFSDFKDFDGYTLPQKYKLEYSTTGQNGTTELRWEFDLLEFAVNRPVDDATFKVN